MKKLFLSLVLCAICSVSALAEDGIFKCRIFNADNDVFMDINLYEEAVSIPGQDILGKVYGYLKKNGDSRVWIVMGVKMSKDGRTATLEMINDYGSEDLVAELSVDDKGVYTLRQQDGSTIKVAGKGKWIKLPKTMVFKKTR